MSMSEISLLKEKMEFVLEKTNTENPDLRSMFNSFYTIREAFGLIPALLGTYAIDYIIIPGTEVYLIKHNQQTAGLLLLSNYSDPRPDYLKDKLLLKMTLLLTESYSNRYFLTDDSQNVLNEIRRLYPNTILGYTLDEHHQYLSHVVNAKHVLRFTKVDMLGYEHVEDLYIFE